MPCAHVEVAATGVGPSTVLIGTGFAQVRCHDVKWGVAHRQPQPDVPNHRGDQITIVAHPGPCVARGIRLTFQRCSHGDDTFLPGRTEAFATKQVSVWCGHSIGVDLLQSRIKRSCSGHHALPFATVVKRDGHIERKAAEHQSQIEKKVRSTAIQHEPHASTGNHFMVDGITKRSIRLCRHSASQTVKEALAKGVPGCPIKGALNLGGQMVPHVGYQEQVSIVPLAHKPKQFCLCGVKREGLCELKWMFRAPFSTKDFGQISLSHLTASLLPRGGGFQSSL